MVNACADNDVTVVVSGTSYDPRKVDEWLPLIFQGVMSEAEARRIKQRNLDSVLTNAQKGTPHGRIPFGYRRVYDPKTGNLINQTPFIQVDAAGDPVRTAEGDYVPVLPEEDSPMALSPEAQVLADAVDALLGKPPATLRGICRELNAKGVPSPRKPNQKTLSENPKGVVKSWDASSLRQLLKNPTIAGRRVHRGEDIGPASWVPIVDYNKWLRLRKMLSDPERLTVTAPRGPAPRHLLSNIALCGSCGARMKVMTTIRRMPRAYACRNEECTQKVTATAPGVEKVVEDVLLALLSRPGYRRKLAAAHQRREQAETSGPDVAELIRAKEAELSEVEEMRGKGELTLRAYAAESKRIEEAIADLREQEVAAVASPVLRKMLSAESLVKYWEDADLMDKREVIRLLLKVTVNRATKAGRIFDESRVIVEPSDSVRSFSDEEKAAKVSA